MTFSEFAVHMYPCWLLGLFMLWTTWKSGNADMLSIHTPTVMRWLKFLVCVSVYRYVILKYLPQIQPGGQEAIRNVSIIPWPATLTVFWEDACHGIPLVLLRRLIGTKWWTIPIHFAAMALIMISFASGHLYQGLVPAILLSAYIPFSVSLGQKRGFGTMMVNHTLYDLTTVLTLKMLVG